MSTELQRRLDASAAPARTETSAPTIVQLIEKMKPEIARALPAHLTPDRMLRMALTELRRNETLQRASAQSLLGAFMLAAQLGLEPGPLGHVYFVPRTVRGEVEVIFVIGYRGFVELAERTGRLRDLYAVVVWQGEPFRYSAGDDFRIEHEPDIELESPGPADFRAAYAVAKLKDGGVRRVVIGKRHIDRARAASAIKNGGPWATDFEAMAAKTAIRRLSALLPQSPELGAALALDDTLAPRYAPGDRLLDATEVEPRRIVALEAAPAAPAEEEREQRPAPDDAPTRPQHRRVDPPAAASEEPVREPVPASDPIPSPAPEQPTEPPLPPAEPPAPEEMSRAEEVTALFALHDAGQAGSLSEVTPKVAADWLAAGEVDLDVISDDESGDDIVMAALRWQVAKRASTIRGTVEIKAGDLRVSRAAGGEDALATLLSNRMAAWAADCPEGARTFMWARLGGSEEGAAVRLALAPLVEVSTGTWLYATPAEPEPAERYTGDSVRPDGTVEPLTVSGGEQAAGFQRYLDTHDHTGPAEPGQGELLP